MQRGSHAGADWLRAADASTERSDEREVDVEVLGCNWDAVHVYLRCVQQVAGAGFGLLYLGITAAECRAALALLRQPRTRWADILIAVQDMGQIAADELNRRMQRK